MIRIRFKTRAEAAKGFYALFTHGAVRGLPGGIFEIPERLLTVLEAESIPFERIPPPETSDETHPVRDPIAAGLQ